MPLVVSPDLVTVRVNLKRRSAVLVLALTVTVLLTDVPLLQLAGLGCDASDGLTLSAHVVACCTVAFTVYVPPEGAIVVGVMLYFVITGTVASVPGWVIFTVFDLVTPVGLVADNFTV